MTSIPNQKPGAPERNPRGLRIVFLGTPRSAVSTLRAVVSAGYPVPLVVTPPDRPKGRGRSLAPSPVKAAALEEDLAILQPEDVNAQESVTRIREARPDALLIVAFGRILRRSLLEVSPLPLNLHFSLLPEYRGAAPVSRAIADGRTVTGVTLQRIVAKLDAGPILTSRSMEIGPEETAGELMERLSGLGADLAVRTLALLERGEARETPQDHTRATLAPMLKKSDGIVRWSRPARELHCHVRAMDPWPGARTSFTGKVRGDRIDVTILRCRVGVPGEARGAAGEVVSAGPDGIVVETGEGCLVLTRLKPAGKRELSAREFTNGYGAMVGDHFRE